MDWRQGAREQFGRIFLSPWAVALGVLFLAGPLAFAFEFASGRGNPLDGGGGSSALILAKGATLGLLPYSFWYSSFLALALVLGGAAGPARPGQLVGTLGAVLAIAALAWLAPVALMLAGVFGPIAVLPPIIAFGIEILEVGGWLALFLAIAALWPRRAPPIVVAVWGFGFVYVQLVDLMFINVLRFARSGPVEPATTAELALSFATPSQVGDHFLGAMLPGPLGSEREAFLAAFPGLYSPWLYFLAALAWIVVPALIARAALRRAAEDAAIEEASA